MHRGGPLDFLDLRAFVPSVPLTISSPSTVASARSLAVANRIVPTFSARFCKTYACSTIVRIKKFDAGGLEGLLQYLESGAPRLVGTSLELAYRDDPDARPLSQTLLTPIEEPAGGPTLRRCKHKTR
jgi:hypothetical protein